MQDCNYTEDQEVTIDKVDFRAKAAIAYALMDVFKPISFRASMLVGTCQAAIQRMTIAQWAKRTAELKAEEAARG